MAHAASTFIHPTADVSPDALIGAGSRTWHQAQGREGAQVSADCILGKNVYVDVGVELGDRIKVENNACIYHGVTVEDGVFIGPYVCFTNDLMPRAITPAGTLKREDDWIAGRILVRRGASIGAGSIILPGTVIGAFALIGAGSIVTHSVPDQALGYGNPARQHGYVCRCGRRQAATPAPGDSEALVCVACRQGSASLARELSDHTAARSGGTS